MYFNVTKLTPGNYQVKDTKHPGAVFMRPGVYRVSVGQESNLKPFRESNLNPSSCDVAALFDPDDTAIASVESAERNLRTLGSGKHFAAAEENFTRVA